MKIKQTSNNQNDSKRPWLNKYIWTDMHSAIMCRYRKSCINQFKAYIMKNNNKEMVLGY